MLQNPIPIRPIVPLLGGWFLVLALFASGTSATCQPRPRWGADPATSQAGTRPGFPPQPQSQPPSLQPENPSPLTPKQQRAVLKANYAKMKQEAGELAMLAKSLQDELNKSNENVLSLDVVDKADKIEKLAKKIKSAAIQ
ncbi:MAG TPA: hypothetical protein VGZ29_09135 [Terriglobia bacterium]|nr:hypothetical protein [Terriglobia bacterium]